MRRWDKYQLCRRQRLPHPCWARMVGKGLDDSVAWVHTYCTTTVVNWFGRPDIALRLAHAASKAMDGRPSSFTLEVPIIWVVRAPEEICDRVVSA